MNSRTTHIPIPARVCAVTLIGLAAIAFAHPRLAPPAAAGATPSELGAARALECVPVVGAVHRDPVPAVLLDGDLRAGHPLEVVHEVPAEPEPELLDLADRMGMLIMDEAFDMWARPKKPNGYSKYWAEWHERDLRDFLRRDRNHPSVIMWEVSLNETDMPKERPSTSSSGGTVWSQLACSPPAS